MEIFTFFGVFSSSAIEDYEKQINELRDTLSEKDKDRLVLQERLSQVEAELQKLSDYHKSTETKYQSLEQQRYSFV